MTLDPRGKPEKKPGAGFQPAERGVVNRGRGPAGRKMAAGRKPLALALLAAGLLAAAPAAAQVPADGALALGEGNAVFALDLYAALGKKPGNLVFSPVGISGALAMTWGGARGNTAEELGRALRLELGRARLHTAYKALNDDLSLVSGGGQRLDLANALCLTGGEVSDEFNRLLEENYGAAVFSGGPEVINNWVGRKTGGGIAKILEKLDPDSVCVLLNAVYFKGFWAERFPAENTREARFRVSAGRQVTVPMMHRRGACRVLNGRDFRAASFPYRGGRLSMTVLLPLADDGLPGLEAQLTLPRLREWLSMLERQPEREYDLYLPRFRLETASDLVPVLNGLGVRDAFAPDRADFTGMGWPKGELWISQARHKAFLEVNEAGTEAAAATAVEMATRSARVPPVFRADHPFFFLVADSRTGALIFLGRLVAPGAR